MTPDLYRIPTDTSGRLAISARPRGGDWLSDEVAGWQRAGVTVVVSLLEADEERDLGLTDEATECAAHGLHFVPVPVPDRGVPTDRIAFAEAVITVADELDNGERVGVHCRQGIGRSGLFAVAVLKALGVSTDIAIGAASAARGRPVPETPEQTEWLRRFAPPTPAPGLP